MKKILNNLKISIKKNKEKFISFFRSKTKTVTAQLTIGIAFIVFICTLMVGLISLSQYRQLSLKQTEESLRDKSHQLAELGSMVLSNEMPGPRDRLFTSIQGLTNSEFWIVSRNGQIVASTAGFNNSILAASLNDKYLHQLVMDNSIITYDYSSYFGEKTLTIVTPVSEKHQINGAVLLHKNVKLIYSSNTYLGLLIFISLIISLVLSIILGTLYSRFFTKPIKRITQVALEITKGNYNIKTGIVSSDEIGELANTIDTMTSEINRNIAEIKTLEGRAKELVANVSHEFKTPLTLIRGYAENLNDNTTKPSKETYEKIISNTIILEKLVNELLDLSKF